MKACEPGGTKTKVFLPSRIVTDRINHARKRGPGAGLRQRPARNTSSAILLPEILPAMLRRTNAIIELVELQIVSNIFRKKTPNQYVY